MSNKKNIIKIKFCLSIMLFFTLFYIFEISLSNDINKENILKKQETKIEMKNTNELITTIIPTNNLSKTTNNEIKEDNNTKNETFKIENDIIWPIIDVILYDDNFNEIEVVLAGTPILALCEENQYLKVSYEDKIGYIETNKCLINLPNVMQLEMKYDITNSYSSIYKIHNYNIENVTNEVLYPYAKINENEYLVPLLIPVAKQLFEVENQLIEKGYSLKIYDAYRPYEVTKTIYDKTMEFLNNNPKYKEYMLEPINGETFSLGNFLAKNISNHNYGVAIDVTLIDLKTGEELEMQSPMHELSTRSIISLNNENANLLQEIMISNGFTGLISEWWHFQMNEYKINYATFQIMNYEKM